MVQIAVAQRPRCPTDLADRSASAGPPTVVPGPARPATPGWTSRRRSRPPACPPDRPAETGAGGHAPAPPLPPLRAAMSALASGRRVQGRSAIMIGGAERNSNSPVPKPRRRSSAGSRMGRYRVEEDMERSRSGRGGSRTTPSPLARRPGGTGRPGRRRWTDPPRTILTMAESQMAWAASRPQRSRAWASDWRTAMVVMPDAAAFGHERRQRGERVVGGLVEDQRQAAGRGAAPGERGRQPAGRRRRRLRSARRPGGGRPTPRWPCPAGTACPAWRRNAGGSNSRPAPG